MSDQNKCFFTGRLTRDPVVKNAGGANLIEFSLASNRKYKKNDELKEDTTFVELKAWSKTAENILSSNVAKGDLVRVETVYSMRVWDDNGNKRYFPEFTIMDWGILVRSSKNSKSEAVESVEDGSAPEVEDEQPAKKRGRPKAVKVEEDLEDINIPF